MTIYLRLIKQLNLETYLKILLEKNTTNGAQYHNFYHTLCVMKNAYMIAGSEELSDTDERILCVAALFHDFDHSQGKEKDNVNVQTAISKFLEYSQESQADNDKIVEIIKATEYPYVIEDSELNKLQQIIRDADLLQICADNYLQMNILGLSKELNVPVDKFVSGTISFLKGLKFYTKYAKRKIEEVFEDRIEELEFLTDVLK
jgi:hypothetical protein